MQMADRIQVFRGDKAEAAVCPHLGMAWFDELSHKYRIIGRPMPFVGEKVYAFRMRTISQDYFRLRSANEGSW
jgi:hypothetical protein